MSGLNLLIRRTGFWIFWGRRPFPLALVAIGGTLATVPVRRSVGVAAYMSVFKLMVQPAATYGVANFVFGLPPLWVATITLLAAMPTACWHPFWLNNIVLPLGRPQFNHGVQHYGHSDIVVLADFFRAVFARLMVNPWQ